jgi:hypothetical protein
MSDGPMKKRRKSDVSKNACRLSARQGRAALAPLTPSITPRAAHQLLLQRLVRQSWIAGHGAHRAGAQTDGIHGSATDRLGKRMTW